MAFQSNAFQSDAFQSDAFQQACTLYDDPIAYNAPINYNGVCTAPPTPTGNPKGGGLIINIYERIDPYERKRRREDEEILIL